jgi:cellulose synthase/poly-beta-1,6-N-acetylglucosamine synthase-like glycosyltransferase/Flp pilus assembly protein TadD
LNNGINNIEKMYAHQSIDMIGIIMSDFHHSKIKKLKRALKHRAEDPQANLDLCLLHLKRGKHPLALEQISLLRNNPLSEPAIIDRMEAIILYSSGDLEKAKHLFKLLVRNGHGDAEIEQYLAKIAVNRNDLPSAIDHLEAALALEGRNGEMINDLGVLYFIEKRYPEAETLFQKVIRDVPDYALAYRNLGSLYEETKQPGNAVGVWESYIRQFPDDPEGYKNLGILNYRGGNDAKALSMLQKAETLGIRDSEIPYFMGMTYLGHDDFEMARHAFRKSLDINPDLEPARSALTLCYCRLEGANQAYELLKKGRAEFSTPIAGRRTSGKNAKKTYLSVLVPAFNEANRILSNIREIKKFLSGMGWSYEIVIVDDGSDDDTYEIIEMLSREIKELRVFQAERNIGKGMALRQAALKAKGEIVAFLDADLELHPRLIASMIERMKSEGADVVLGSKRHPESAIHYPWHRKIISNMYYLVNRFLFGIPVKDTQTGVKIFKRRILEEVLPKLIEKKYAFDLELIVNIHALGYKIIEAPITLDFSRKFSRIGLFAIFLTAIDTLAIFYRLRILHYYDRTIVTPTRFPRVSIIIPFKNYSAYPEESLRACLNLDYPDFEVIFLPDGELNLPNPQLRHPLVRVIPTGPIPPSNKREIGVEQSTGEIITFLDDDAYPIRGWLRKVVGYFENDQVAGVGGPAVTPESDDLMQRLSGKIFASPMVSGGYNYRYIPKQFQEVDDYPSCNLSLRKKDFLAAGGFSTRYWPGEDTILCLRIVKDLGKKILYEPDALVYHHRRRLFGAHLKQVASYALHRGFFVKKFPETSRRLSYFIPSLFVTGLVAGLFTAVLHPLFAWLYGSVFALYAVLISTPFILSLNLKIIILGMMGTFATHLTYGVYFLVGLLKRDLKR